MDSFFIPLVILLKEYRCMMNDLTGRHITYLRLSVTDLCNFRCRYCMDEGGICSKVPREEILSIEELTELDRKSVV